MFTLIIGGSASGKSDYAEKYVLSLEAPGERIYIATMEPFGEEARARIERHHTLRKDRGFRTVERYTDLAGLRLPEDSNVLLEDLGNLAANEMFSRMPARNACETAEAVERGVRSLRRSCTHLTVVANEVFSGGTSYEGETLSYMKALAAAGRTLADLADRAIEVVCGVPVILRDGTGELPESVQNSQSSNNDRYGQRDQCGQHVRCGQYDQNGQCDQKGHYSECGGNGMIFVTGPLFSGKQAYIQRALGWNEEEFRRRAVRDVQDLAAAAQNGEDLITLAETLAQKEVVLATETGGGIVPSDPVQRAEREAAGRLSCLLAERAGTVIRVCCGLPQLLKGKSPGET